MAIFTEEVKENVSHNEYLACKSSNKRKIIRRDGCQTNDDIWFNQAFKFCEDVRKQIGGGQEYWVLLQCLQQYAIGEITMVELKKLLKRKFPMFVSGFINLFDCLAQPSEPESEEMIIRNRETKQNKKMINLSTVYMSTTKLDHRDLTPSYQFLPSYLSSGEQNIEFGPEDTRKELNCCCYSKCKSGSGKRVWPRDHAEKMMNEREDELYERDMLKGWIKSTKEEATKLNACLDKGKFKNCGEIKEQVYKYFKSYNFRVVEKIYGNDVGQLMVTQLLDTPQAVLPTLINRLDQVYTSLTNGNRQSI